MPAVEAQPLPSFATSDLRSRLRKDTAQLHADLDGSFAALDLTGRDAYRRFLETNAMALIPLERALTHSGIAHWLTDWPQRQRTEAITQDLAALNGSFEKALDPGAYSHLESIGAAYVLEGSRLGGAYMLKTVQRSSDPDVRAATSYLKHGLERRLWSSFLAILENFSLSPQEETEVVAGARRAFDLFSTAAKTL